MTEEFDKADGLVACLMTICDPGLSSNPVAWFKLEKAGFTREALQETVDSGGWLGDKPLFENAPSRNDPFWKYLEEKEST